MSPEFGGKQETQVPWLSLPTLLCVGYNMKIKNNNNPQYLKALQII